MNKPKKIKAQRYWRRPHSLQLYGTKKTAKYYSGFAAAEVAPVVILPADAASVERMVEQMVEGILSVRNGAWTTVDLSRAALAAIGVKGGAK